MARTSRSSTDPRPRKGRRSRKGAGRAAVKRKSNRELRSDTIPGREHYEGRSTWDDYPWTIILGDSGYGDGSTLAVPAVWACVKAIAEDIGKLPIRLKRDDNRDSPGLRAAERLLQDPNPRMGPVQFLTQLTHWAVGWGDGFAEIQWSGGGRPIALWPIAPDRVSIWLRRADGAITALPSVLMPDMDIVYRVANANGETVELEPESILHIKGLSYDGVRGYSPLSLFSQTLGNAQAMQNWQSAFYRNGTQTGVVLSYPGKLTPQELNNARKAWDERHRGARGAFKVAILDDGVKLDKMSVNPEDAQFIESAEFAIEEICRIFRMPPHMVQDLRRATFANIEHQSIEYATQTLQPWVKRWEEELEHKVTRYFDAAIQVELVLDALLRGDTAARYGAYQTALSSGWLSINDVRGLEKLPPVDGGNQYLRPLNMTPIDAPPPPVPEEPALPPSDIGQSELPASRSRLALNGATPGATAHAH